MNVIPKPTQLIEKSGVFEITPDTRILFSAGNKEARRISEMLARQINTASGYNLTVNPIAISEAVVDAIFLTTGGSPATLGPEGYQLIVEDHSVTLRAPTPAGLFYGVQTIRQLLPPEIENESPVLGNFRWNIPCVQMLDQPRFSWRGMLLDCCRHFMTKDFVKRYLDLLALYKMNRFHWHLTEDQGWRIEIMKYPELIETSAWRKEADGTIYGGYYTQQDIREVVQYAAERFITVIPEIELPGHSLAALAAFPQISCTGGPFEVMSDWGIFKEVYCAGNEATFQFLENVLTEVIELFPAPYLHIGGDECPKERWQNCPKCQARIKAEGLKDEFELQSYFIKRIEKFLNTRNRQIIGWDEILEGGLAPGATVQAWRNVEGAIAAAKSGHPAIVSPVTHAYFDYPIEKTNLEKTYEFHPVPAGLTAAEEKYILGGECTMWTERAPQETIDSKMFPRILGICEALWTGPKDKNFEQFRNRVGKHYPRLDKLGVQYGPEALFEENSNIV
jgi:hexosaminidase